MVLIEVTYRDNRWVPLGLGYIMREAIIGCLTATAVLGGVLLGGTAVAAVNTSTTTTPIHMQGCPLGYVELPMLHTCMPTGGGG